MVSIKKIKKSKIVCTLGPATNSREVLEKLISAGMNVARLNFSHGTHEQHEKVFNLIREVDDNIAILCDIQGPKIRIGTVDPPVTLYSGKNIKITTDSIENGDENLLSISHKGFLNDVVKGNYIFINDGLVKLTVENVNKKERYADCKITSGGLISSRKGVNIPSGKLSTVNPTEKDIKDLKFIAKLHPEYVAASFVANAREVKKVRQILSNEGGFEVKIISKIERPIALENFGEILDASDAIMVARGDLGVEIPFYELPLKQKEIILKSNIHSKPVIVATQMLESMITQPVPTRAEVSDVFNAIFDRSDAVMLSAETSVGKYPDKTVQVMSDIIQNAEKNLPHLNPNELDSPEQETYETIGHGVYTLSYEFNSLNYRGKIICFTRGGKSARMISKYRPPMPIIAMTSNKTTARQLNLVWGVDPVFLKKLDLSKNTNSEKTIQTGLFYLVQMGLLEESEHVIVTIPSIISPVRSALIGVFYVLDILEQIKDSKDFGGLFSL
ncbi:MAG: pyruvate kinase [Promethearchaeota archaeon]